jgi:hypothetical protein
VLKGTDLASPEAWGSFVRLMAVSSLFMGDRTFVGLSGQGCKQKVVCEGSFQEGAV